MFDSFRVNREQRRFSRDQNPEFPLLGKWFRAESPRPSASLVSEPPNQCSNYGYGRGVQEQCWHVQQSLLKKKEGKKRRKKDHYSAASQVLCAIHGERHCIHSVINFKQFTIQHAGFRVICEVHNSPHGMQSNHKYMTPIALGVLLHLNSNFYSHNLILFLLCNLQSMERII